MKPELSVVIIGKDEEQSLHSTLVSLEEFKRLGGDMIFVDTGSSDSTAQIAESFGMRTYREGKRFVISVSKDEAEQINNKFVVEGEEKIISKGAELFNYAEARNYATSLAKNDYIVTIDCDEILTNFNIQEIERLFKKGYSRISYDYIWSHTPDGNPDVRFFSGSRLFNRTKMKWIGYVHETLSGQDNQYTAPTEVIRIDHWGRYKPSTAKYLATLAYALYKEPFSDRNLHYFGRELSFHKRYKSAINVLTQHVNLRGWAIERSQSMMLIGDCHQALGNDEEALDSWVKSFNIYSLRREPLLRLAEYHYKKNNLELVSAWAKMALEIKGTKYYSNREENYTWKPHFYLYLAKWWLGDKAESKYHFGKCLEYCPTNKKFLDDTKYYYPDYPDNGIEGWMTFPELYWLYSVAKGMDTVLEIGCWKGRSTHALLSGSKNVTVIDHFKGSNDKRDFTCNLAKKQNVHSQFMRNVGHFKNLQAVLKMSSEDAIKQLPASTRFDMIFIDGSHLYQDVLRDIKLWTPKAKKMICGHDYSKAWPGVMKAVNETIGKLDGVHDSIWFKYIK